MRALAVILTFLWATGCGGAGTWNDDPKNWQRAFGGAHPGTQVVHSFYWKSAHWTHEYEYFFHVRADEELQAELFEVNELVRVEGDALSETVFSPPEWFLPDGDEAYEAWKVDGSTFRVFVHSETGDLFLTENQL